MHYRPLIKRLTPWLTAYLLLVSVGMPLQRIYCACAGEAWLAVLADGHDCPHPAMMAGHGGDDGHEPASEPAVASCCNPGQEATTETCSPGDCGSAEVILAQLDLDFMFKAKAFAGNFDEILPPAALRVWSPQPPVSRSITARGPPPPELPAGRALLVAHQTFLI